MEPGQAEDGRSVLKVTATDYILGKKLELDADIVALAAAIIPSAATKEMAGLFKVTLNPDGFFKEAHVKLRPVEFATDGVYLCWTGSLSQVHTGNDQPVLWSCRPGLDASLP